MSSHREISRLADERDRAKGGPPRPFETNWFYEWGRQCANAMIAARVHPLQVVEFVSQVVLAAVEDGRSL